MRLDIARSWNLTNIFLFLSFIYNTQIKVKNTISAFAVSYDSPDEPEKDEDRKFTNHIFLFLCFIDNT